MIILSARVYAICIEGHASTVAPMAHILLADDNSMLRRSSRRLLETCGYDVCGEAENGREAIAKADGLRPDLIILDFAMPLMTGLEAAKVLSRNMPDIPIILFTNYAEELNEEQLRIVGISAVVAKSKAATLVSTVNSLLGPKAA